MPPNYGIGAPSVVCVQLETPISQDEPSMQTAIVVYHTTLTFSARAHRFRFAIILQSHQPSVY